MEIEAFERLGESTPVIGNLIPGGSYAALDLYRAGGIALVAGAVLVPTLLPTLATKLLGTPPPRTVITLLAIAVAIGTLQGWGLAARLSRLREAYALAIGLEIDERNAGVARQALRNARLLRSASVSQGA